MKKELKHFIMGASTMAVLMGGLTFAANRSETIQRTFRDIKIKLNGTEITPKDATGKVVEPFIIDGTTYLPVRAVGEAMGLDVDWDNDTSTVLLADENDKKGAVYLELKHISYENYQGKNVELDVPQIISRNADTSAINEEIKSSYRDGHDIYGYERIKSVSNNYQDVFSFAWHFPSAGDGPQLGFNSYHFNNKTGEILSNEEVLKMLGTSKEAFLKRYEEVLVELTSKVFLDLEGHNGYLGNTINTVEEFIDKIKKYSVARKESLNNLPIFVDSTGDIYVWMPFMQDDNGGHFWAYETIVNLTKGEFAETSKNNAQLLNQLDVSTNYTEEVMASSTLPAQGNFTYEASHLTDGKLNTVWSEGVAGNGIGETITIKRTYQLSDSNASKEFSLFFIQNGYGLGGNKWMNNARVKSLKMYFNGKYVTTIEINKNYDFPLNFDISQYGLSAKSGEECTFTFEITDVYPGKVYEDTVISEIGIY